MTIWAINPGCITCDKPMNMDSYDLIIFGKYTAAPPSSQLPDSLQKTKALDARMDLLF